MHLHIFIPKYKHIQYKHITSPFLGKENKRISWLYNHICEDWVSSLSASCALLSATFFFYTGDMTFQDTVLPQNKCCFFLRKKKKKSCFLFLPVMEEACHTASYGPFCISFQGGGSVLVRLLPKWSSSSSSPASYRGSPSTLPQEFPPQTWTSTLLFHLTLSPSPIKSVL